VIRRDSMCRQGMCLMELRTVKVGMFRKMKQLFVLFVLSTLVGTSAIVRAALPVAVDGQQLPTLAPMLEKVQKSVVSISTDLQLKLEAERGLGDPFFRRFVGQQEVRKRHRLLAAAGVVIDAQNGYILTNEHSISGANKITVTFSDGASVPAQLLGVDKVSDVAVIQVDMKNLDHLTEIDIGDSNTMRVGDFVVSVGDPLGSQSTITSGLISALGKGGVLKKHQNFIQSDAGYGPGILVNLRGEFIGLNIARVAQTAGSTRIGFSTPSNLALQLQKQIVEFGVPQRGYLALQTQDLTAELVKAFGLSEGYGAVVTRVAKGSTAEKAGILVGDVVLKMDGKVINRSRDLRILVNYQFAGDVVALTVLRDGEEVSLVSVLDSSNKSLRMATMIHHQLDGATFNEVAPGQLSGDVLGGVLATKVEKNSIAWNHGVRANDLVVSANRKKVKSLTDFRQAISNKDVLMLNIVRDDGALFLLLQ